MNSLLEVKNLKVKFLGSKNTTYAVNDVSFSIEEGETLGVVGESGSGKSVTVKSILRLLEDNAEISGSIIFNGQDYMKKDQKYMRKIRGSEISMIFQDPMTSLNPVFTIGTQMKRLIKRHRKGITRDEIENISIKYLELVGISDAKKRLKSYPHEFSGGMRQRVIIAMALCLQAKLIIADEPTTALDVTIQAQILNLINEINKNENRSVILITHDLGVVANSCDRVMVMYSGVIMEITTAKELFENPKHPYTKGLLESVPKNSNQRLTPIQGNPPDMTIKIKGCPFYKRCKYKSEKCEKTLPNLINISKEHMVRCHLFQGE